MSPTPMNAALFYAQKKQWAVFPLHSINADACTCGHSDCSSPGKHPRTPRGLKDATTDPEQIRAWWDENPTANIGVATGSRSRLAVLDIDDPAQFEPFTNQHGKLPPTLLARTGKGVHLYYATDNGEVRNKARIFEGIDVRGEGGYVVAPPSLHVSGRRYSWQDDDPSETTVAPWPTKLLALMEKPKPSRPTVEVPAPSYKEGGTPYGLKALAEEIATLKGARQGERNETLNQVAFNLFQLVAGNQLEDSHVTGELTFCARGIGLSDREIEGTLRSARSAGTASPRVPPEPQPTTTPPKVSSSSSFNSSERKESVTKWPRLDDAALYGVVGEVVRAIRPHTEADDAALVLSTLSTLGASVGGSPFAMADGARHPMKLNVVVVGRTSQSRKGSSFANVKRADVHAYPDFEERIMGGLASGEGLIQAVRDPDDDDEFPSVDKRLLVYEPEFARVLRVAAREGNTLSTVIRELWDTDRARVMTRKDPIKATGTHVAILAHITLEELRRSLTETDIANGFANRFLFAMARRSKTLPFGGSMTEEELHNLAQQIRAAVESAKQVRQVTWADETKDRWVEVYESLDTEVDGMVGAVVARGAPQMLRLAVSYAALDGSAKIRPEHLEAARAVWDYCDRSAHYIFGDSLGDEVADRLWTMVEDAGETGIDLTEVNRRFSNNLKAERLAAAYQLLQSRDLIEVRQEATGGRGRPRTILLSRTKETNKTNKDPSEGSDDPSSGVSSFNSFNSPEREEGIA